MHIIYNFIAEGCPTFINPTGTWTKEESGEIILVGCKENNRKWKMRCIGNNWIGLAGNCTSSKSILLTMNMSL